MVRSRVAFYALAALVVGVVAVARSPLGVITASSAAITFETPTIVDPIHTNGEPDIAVDPQGRVFNSGPTGRTRPGFGMNASDLRSRYDRLDCSGFAAVQLPQNWSRRADGRGKKCPAGDCFGVAHSPKSPPGGTPLH